MQRHGRKSSGGYPSITHVAVVVVVLLLLFVAAAAVYFLFGFETLD